MAIINFYRGERTKYNVVDHADGLFFAADTHELLMNNSSYGNSVKSVTFSGGKLTITLSNDEVIETTLSNATTALAGLMSPEDKSKLDGLQTGSEISSSISDINQKVGSTEFTGTNYISEEESLTDAAIKLDSELKSTNDSLSTLSSSAVKQVKVNNVALVASEGAVNIPLASTTVDGVLSKTDKGKIDKINISGEGNSYLSDDGIYKALTKASVGLGSVDNTSDENKPVSTLQRAAINAVQSSIDDHIADKQNPHEVTASQVGLGNVTNDAQVKRTEMGVANGVATLNSDGKIPMSQLDGQQSSVQGIDKVATSSTLPTEGLSEDYMVWATDTKSLHEWNGTSWSEISPKGDTIYNFRNSDATGDESRNNILYRWDGSIMVEISASLAIGETSATAYAGDKGKANRDALLSMPSNIISDISSPSTSANSLTFNFKKAGKGIDGFSRTAEEAQTISIPAASTSAAGVMSAADKSALDGAVNKLSGIDFDDYLKINNAGVGILQGYTIGATDAKIVATDTINQAIGKLEKALDNLNGGAGSITDQIQTAIDALVNGASEGYKTLKDLEDKIKAQGTATQELSNEVTTIEGKLTTIQGSESTVGSINNAIKQSKDYADSKVTWVEL